MTRFPGRRTFANMFALLLASAPSIAQQGFTDAFPPEEFAARRERVIAEIGEGVAILQARPSVAASRRSGKATSSSSCPA